MCVLDPEVGGGTAYFPPPIDTESWEKAVTATSRGAHYREQGAGAGNQFPPYSAQAPGCVSSAPHFTPFLGNIHKSQDSEPMPGDQVSGGAGG